jgi:hypothetical protein
LGIGWAILAIFANMLSRSQVIPTKIVSDGMVTHKEVLFWYSTVASVDEVTTRTGFEAIILITSVIRNKRGILTEKGSLIKSPGVAGKREAF